MKTVQEVTDKFAIGLSMLCAIHCLLLPLLLVALPSIGALQLQNEAFHLWMILAVLPISGYALTMGCRNHRHYMVVVAGFAGLVVLCSSLFMGHAILGEAGEKVATVFGALLVAVSHILNFRLCRRQIDCGCPEWGCSCNAQKLLSVTWKPCNWRDSLFG